MCLRNEDVSFANLDVGLFARYTCAHSRMPLLHTRVPYTLVPPDSVAVSALLNPAARGQEPTPEKGIASLAFGGACVQSLGVAWSQIFTVKSSVAVATSFPSGDAECGTLKHTLPGHEGLVRSVHFSPKGTFLLTGAFHKTIRHWDRAYTRFSSKREVENFVAELQDLRNNLAHAQDISGDWEIIRDLANNLHRIVLGPDNAGGCEL